MYDVWCVDVMPPDEYHLIVNNSVFTNMVVKMTLEFAHEVAELLKQPERQKKYKYFMDRIYIPFDADVGYHPEFDGYVRGRTAVCFTAALGLV